MIAFKYNGCRSLSSFKGENWKHHHYISIMNKSFRIHLSWKMMHGKLVTWFTILKNTCSFFIYYRACIARKPFHLCLPISFICILVGWIIMYEAPFGSELEETTLSKGKSLHSLPRVTQCAEKIHFKYCSISVWTTIFL